jgi:type I restriction enzyme S subunit
MDKVIMDVFDSRNYVIQIEVTSIPQQTAVAAKAISLPLPALPEQKKIADCLSSLDELVTAETQKLDTLKAHKKGLMQQLFPALDEVQG